MLKIICSLTFRVSPKLPLQMSEHFAYTEVVWGRYSWFTFAYKIVSAWGNSHFWAVWAGGQDNIPWLDCSCLCETLVCSGSKKVLPLNLPFGVEQQYQMLQIVDWLTELLTWQCLLGVLEAGLMHLDTILW